jgi:hypothetical protein
VCSILHLLLSRFESSIYFSLVVASYIKIRPSVDILKFLSFVGRYKRFGLTCCLRLQDVTETLLPVYQTHGIISRKVMVLNILAVEISKCHILCRVAVSYIHFSLSNPVQRTNTVPLLQFQMTGDGT